MVRIPFLALLLAVSVSATARAQLPDTTRRAATGQRRDTTARRLAPLEVHASIAPTAGPTIGSAIPARISIVSFREIEAWEPRVLADVLGSQAGVSLYDDLGSPYKLNLSTRGFVVGPTVGLPPGVSVFLDGVRQNEPDAQEVNFDLLPIEHLERVELLSGSASLLGPNSLGGAVNLITRRGAPGPATAEVELSAGSFGAASAEASLSGLAHGLWDYYASGGYERETGWRAATNAENYNGFVNLGRRGPARGVSLQAFAARSRAETAGSLPESIVGIAPRTNFTAGDYEDLNVQQLALSGYRPVARGRGSFTTYLRRSQAERFNVNQPPDDNVRALTTNGTVGGTADWRWGTTRQGRAVALRIGLDGAVNRVRVRLLAEPSAGSFGDDQLTTDVRSPSWDVAGYSIADVRLGRLVVSGGARYDYVRIPYRNLLDGAGDTTSVFRRLNPRGGVSIDLGRGSSIYASAGHSFRAPAILELGCADPEATCPLPFALGDDPPLRPVRATTYETGVRWLHGALALNGSLYRTYVRDEIFFVASETALLSGFFTNIDRTRRDGLELSLQTALLDERLAMYANYAYTRASFQAPFEMFSIRAEDDFSGRPLAGPNDVMAGDRIPLTPANQIKTGVLARLPRHFELGADVRYVGRQWLRGDEANETRPLDGYAITRARLGFSRRSWEVTAVLNNVFNVRRATFGTFNENRQTGELERFLTPATARTLRLIVRRAFGKVERD